MGKLSRVEHPRFGLICGIEALQDIKEGDELFACYNLCLADAPDWYKSLYVHHCRHVRRLSDEDILGWCARQYDLKGKIINLPLDQPYQGNNNHTNGLNMKVSQGA